MSLNVILENGQTIGFGSQAEKDAYFANKNIGYQDQATAVQQSGQTLDQLREQRGIQWNRPGGQGYVNPMTQGNNGSPVQQFTTQTPTLGGWGGMQALNGLLGGYQPVNWGGLLGSFGAPSWGGSFQPMSFGGFQAEPFRQGGMPQPDMRGQPANTGSNMLWTR